MRMPKIGPTKLQAGDIFAVPLGDGTYGAGQVCYKGRDCAFFDVRTNAMPTVSEVEARPVVFRVPMERSIYETGVWPRIGSAPLAGGLAAPASYRTQPVGSNQLYKYRDGQRVSATREEVADLELLANWFEEHIVERLLDHFAGRPNRTVTEFRKIKVYD
jgi:immunity protein 26 of polymorphic toxin system